MQTAILFPGQGSQTPGMRDRAAALRPDLLDLATECVGEDPFPRADEDTRFAQPAILVASLANWGELGELPAARRGRRPLARRADRARRRPRRSPSATPSASPPCAAG